MHRSLTLLSTCLVLALTASGCGGGDDGGGGSGGGSSQAPATKGGKAVEVSMKDIQFKPAQVTVPKGATVRWTNDESITHDVAKTGGAGPDFKSGPGGDMQGGDVYEHKFDVTGTIEYVCTLHSNMKGEVTVK